MLIVFFWNDNCKLVIRTFYIPLDTFNVPTFYTKVRLNTDYKTIITILIILALSVNFCLIVILLSFQDKSDRKHTEKYDGRT